MAYSRTRGNANGRKSGQTMEKQIVKQKFAILAAIALWGCRPFDRKLGGADRPRRTNPALEPLALGSKAREVCASARCSVAMSG